MLSQRPSVFVCEACMCACVHVHVYVYVYGILSGKVVYMYVFVYGIKGHN